MPGTTVADPPSVSLSFANNFWGKDDAGVGPLLDRMHYAKVTGDELKAFYSARAALEEEYAKKLLSLARKPLGSTESGTLRMSLDVVRGEVESMGKAHQNVALQMRSELDEQLSAFHGGMKERRKIVQNGIEKLLKSKNQQTAVVNKARDRYEQDCLKIKGYLAQGHMVMGQEERKNKAKLEKTQIQLSSTRGEYEAAVKVLEETTGRWNRDWKIACDKFQDLEEERIDFMKSSLWSFANIASTVCVSDDASCEKVRLSLEDCDVEKDIFNFIKESGTGQEIPDPPRFIDFTRGDNSDAASEVSDSDNYSVAQFQRTINPAYRSSSPQPSTLESHNGPSSDLGLNANGIDQYGTSNENTPTKLRETGSSSTPRGTARGYGMQAPDDLPQVPHNEYPPDGMTQFCRTGPPSDMSSAISQQTRPESRDAHSDYSAPTSLSSVDPSMGGMSPVKELGGISMHPPVEQEPQKKRSGFLNHRSPFRRKSKGEKDRPQAQPGSRNTWGPNSAQSQGYASGSPVKATTHYGQRPSPSPEPIEPQANFQLSLGNNVFDVASPDARPTTGGRTKPMLGDVEHDPIAAALAELKNGAKEATSRVSADRYAGLATPAPDVARAQRGGMPPAQQTKMPDRTRNYGQTAPANAPPSYDQPQKPVMSRLGAPQPAFTSRQMQQTTQHYQDQKVNMYNHGSRQNSHDAGQQARPGIHARQSSGTNIPRATSPVPMRSTSPRPGYGGAPPARSVSPNPYGTARPRAQSNTPQKPRPESYGGGGGVQGMPRSAGNSPSTYNMPRATSPSPGYGRPASRNGDPNMALQLAPTNGEHGGMGYAGVPPQARGRSGTNVPRPMSQYGAPPGAAGAHGMHHQGHGQGQHDPRMRSKSVGRPGQSTSDGRPVLHFSRAIYMYQAAIPEELSFTKGEMLAVIRHQDDGWWEAEVCSKPGRIGLVPSNYLTAA